MIEGKGITFSASRASDLLAGGSGKTRMNYIFDIALKHLGKEKDIQTAAMQHGVVNERFAIDILTSVYGGKANTNEKGDQVFYPINDYIGATPDAIADDWVGDAKCQYYIYTYLQQCAKIPKKYYIQLQTQMMAMKVDKGLLINYLTKPELYGQDDWEEYPFELHERYKIIQVEPDNEVQEAILIAAEEYHPLIGQCIEILQSAREVDDAEFFYGQLVGGATFRKLKDVNWLTTELEIICHDNTYYVRNRK